MDHRIAQIAISIFATFSAGGCIDAHDAEQDDPDVLEADIVTSMSTVLVDMPEAQLAYDRASGKFHDADANEVAVPDTVLATLAAARAAPTTTASSTGCSWHITYARYGTYPGDKYSGTAAFEYGVEVWGQYNSAGHYCGEASDHIWSYPLNNFYATSGLVQHNMWSSHGNPIASNIRIAYPASHTYFVTYSGGFWTNNADAAGEWASSAQSPIKGWVATGGWM
jgi:hypothetical protein